MRSRPTAEPLMQKRPWERRRSRPPAPWLPAPLGSHPTAASPGKTPAPPATAPRPRGGGGIPGLIPQIGSWGEAKEEPPLLPLRFWGSPPPSHLCGRRGQLCPAEEMEGVFVEQHGTPPAARWVGGLRGRPGTPPVLRAWWHQHTRDVCSLPSPQTRPLLCRAVLPGGCVGWVRGPILPPFAQVLSQRGGFAL